MSHFCLYHPAQGLKRSITNKKDLEKASDGTHESGGEASFSDNFRGKFTLLITKSLSANSKMKIRTLLKNVIYPD